MPMARYLDGLAIGASSTTSASATLFCGVGASFSTRARTSGFVRTSTTSRGAPGSAASRSTMRSPTTRPMDVDAADRLNRASFIVSYVLRACRRPRPLLENSLEGEAPLPRRRHGACRDTTDVPQVQLV